MPVTGGFCPLPLRLGGDALTGLTAEQHARLAADLVALKRTQPIAVFTWDAPGGADTAATITFYTGMNGSGLAHAPTAGVISGGGALQFTWSSGRFVDEYQVSCPIRPRIAVASFAGATYRKPILAILANGVVIRAFDAAGSAVNPQPGGTCVLW
jgi:hypothetical protein